MSSKTKIAVVSSLNFDYLMRVNQFHQSCEIAMADGLEIGFGGKGANQLL